MLASCQDSIEVLEVDDQLLRDGLLSLDNQQVTREVNKLTFDLGPGEDNHVSNLRTLVIRLDDINGLMVSNTCYACIYTLPPQSEIEILVDSLGTFVGRTIDILTADDATLSCTGVHF